ncbi:MAG: MFS transporter, partial [Jatrophihabitans endophyticus]|nr:MFS transporter [Jatrophihabitans endophyticus]
VPRNQRGSASGMRGTFFNSGTSLSIGVFFSLMIAGLAATLPSSLFTGLTRHGVSHATATGIANQPPVGSLFSAFLGYNPVKNLLGKQGLAAVKSSSNRATLTGHEFFPNLISGPFHHGLIIVFSMAIAMSLIGALASLFRGTKYVHQDEPAVTDTREPAAV